MSLTAGSLQDKFFNFIPQLPATPTTLLGRHFTARLYHLLAIPAEIITRLADGILGIAGYLAHLGTGGKRRKIWKFTARHQLSFGSIFSAVAKRIILFINPQAKMRVEAYQTRINCGHGANLGVFSATLFNAVESTLRKPSESFPDVIKKALLAIPLLISSIADVIFGVLTGIFALATLGIWTKCNSFSYDHLNLALNGWAITISLAPNFSR